MSEREKPSFKSDLEWELKVLADVISLLKSLDEAARLRVIEYVDSRFSQ